MYRCRSLNIVCAICTQVYNTIGVILFTFEVQSNREYLSSILHYSLRSFPEKLESMIVVCVLCSYVKTNPLYTNKVYDLPITCYWLGTPHHVTVLVHLSTCYLPSTVRPTTCYISGTHIHKLLFRTSIHVLPSRYTHPRVTVQLHPSRCYCPGRTNNVLPSRYRTPIHVLQSRYAQPRVTV
jgi:hypothetical protein